MRVCLCIYVFVIVFSVYVVFIAVFIQVVLHDHQFGADALTSIFHIASFRFDGELERDVSLLIDQSEHLPDRITCVKSKSENYS